MIGGRLDTRALTRRIASRHAHAVIAHSPTVFRPRGLKRQAAEWQGLVGLDLAKDATACSPSLRRACGPGRWLGAAPRRVEVVSSTTREAQHPARATPIGARATVVPAGTSAADILARNPDGVLLSNGPGDPAATGEYAVPEIAKLVDSGKPVFGICLGHQMLARALGASTVKMDQGHHGANHPVKDLDTGRSDVSMNHGFTVNARLPPP